MGKKEAPEKRGLTNQTNLTNQEHLEAMLTYITTQTPYWFVGIQKISLKKR
ncbi:MAG: hypothetical protein SchgKO_17040 [Schleiferiaceae bacterium]